jgi:Na+/proline symporter
MVASFLSAFMATIEAHYNLVASYAVNDIYRRFLVKSGSDAHYVRASRWMTVGVAVTAGIVTLLLPSVLGAFRFKMELMAGLGLVFVLRWFWWRINATTEMVTLATSIVVALGLNALPQTSGGDAAGSALRLLVVVVVSAVAALVTVRITEHEPLDHLAKFYRRVRPPGAWGPVAVHAGAEAQASGFGRSTLVEILLGVVFVLCGMLGVGKVILGEPAVGWPLVAVATMSGWTIIRRILNERTA